MTPRFAFLKLRRRVAWWCIRPGCWARSHVVQMGSRRPYRGNLCVVHLHESIAAFCAAED